MIVIGFLFMFAHWVYAAYLVCTGQPHAMFCFLFGFVYLIAGALGEAL